MIKLTDLKTIKYLIITSINKNIYLKTLKANEPLNLINTNKTQTGRTFYFLICFRDKLQQLYYHDGFSISVSINSKCLTGAKTKREISV